MILLGLIFPCSDCPSPKLQTLTKLESGILASLASANESSYLAYLSYIQSVIIEGNRVFVDCADPLW